jgi:hypothetical protein
MGPLIGPRRRHRLTDQQRYVLSRMAEGAEVWIDHGEYFLEGCLVGIETVRSLVTAGLITLPLPGLALFLVPDQPGVITDAGRVALDWSVKK